MASQEPGARSEEPGGESDALARFLGDSGAIHIAEVMAPERLAPDVAESLAHFVPYSPSELEREPRQLNAMLLVAGSVTGPDASGDWVGYMKLQRLSPSELAIRDWIVNGGANCRLNLERVSIALFDHARRRLGAPGVRFVVEVDAVAELRHWFLLRLGFERRDPCVRSRRERERHVHVFSWRMPAFRGQPRFR
jgi:hypothetical protein